MLLNVNDKRISWQGVISFKKQGDTIMPWRLPCSELDFYDADLQVKAAKSSGVRLSFYTDSVTIVLNGKINNFDGEDCKFDLVIDNEIIATEIMDTATGRVFFKLPHSKHQVIELWFPPNAGIELYSLELADGAIVAAVEDSRPKWLIYGSSITHCYMADSPALTWPAVVARKMNFNLTNLGYAGQCKIDPMLARLVRDTPADIITLKLGINTHDGDFIERTFSAAVVGTIATVREKHPNIPLVVCSPIWSPPRETVGAGVTLVRMRELIAGAVELFKKHDDQCIYYVDGLKLFGSESHTMLPDDLHPNTAGMGVLAEHFIHEVFVNHNIKVL